MKTYLALLLTLFLASGCDHGPERLLRIGTNVWPGYEPLYLARERGYLAKDLRLIEYPSASEVIRAFRNRSLEAASLTLDEVLLLRESNIPVKIILVHDVSNGADVIVARSGIHSIDKLKGKRVAVESGALGAFVITRALEVHGMKVSDVRIINLDVNLHEEAFRTGQIDAAVTFEPIRTRLLNEGGREVFTSREIPNEIVDVMVVHADVYAKNPDKIRQLVAAWFKALDDMEENREQAYALMSRRLQISPAEVEESYTGLTIPSREENKQMLSGDRPPLQQALVNIQRVLEQNGLLAKGIDIKDTITDSAL